jgi:hypothetical protein
MAQSGMRQLVVLGVALFGLGLQARADPVYEVVDLSALLPDNGGSQLIDLRDNGTASGMLVGNGGRWKPVVWRADGGIEVFDFGFYEEYFLRAGNGSGLIVGQLPGSSLGWARVGNGLECIPTTEGCGPGALYLSSISYDVNEAGVFVGQQALPLPGGGFRFEAYRGQLSPHGVFDLHGLGLYQDQFNTAALAIDDLGRIAGFATLNAVGAEQQALLWLPHEVRELGPPGRYRRPTAISDSGHIVGEERGPGGAPGGFFGLRWHVDQPGEPGELLPALPASTSSSPRDVNDQGWVVGTATTGSGPLDQRGWLLDEHDLHDLNGLLSPGGDWLILAANAIDSAGHIAATARYAATPGTRAVILRRLSHDQIFVHDFAGD